MSKENLDQFIQKVTDDEQLLARIGDEMDADHDDNDMRFKIR